MKPIYADLKHNSGTPLYVQLYDYIKEGVMRGDFLAGERLPSLRDLSEQLSVSITTCARAYDQLIIEGYLRSRPNSGFYVSSVPGPDRSAGGSRESGPSYEGQDKKDPPKYRCDPDSFDFAKWRKCFTKVMNEKSEEMLTPQDPQGEYALRSEISRYLYSARGVKAGPGDIVIGAGVQQLTSRLAGMLREIGIDFVSVEDPGYMPVRHIFSDFGFNICPVPVKEDGIEIERLPVNIGTAVYVSPSNQFPTGSVMPAARRYRLLEWAEQNGSVVIEDDYDSELRYFGSPVPALKSIDGAGRVVYLGSFSSTLFPAIRISYMVLPPELSALSRESMTRYDQTCSKAEQLVLAEYMKNGSYQTGIRKLRKLYSRKLAEVLSAFSRYGGGTVTARNTKSGISVRLDVASEKPNESLLLDAEKLRLHMISLGGGPGKLMLYYDQIPLNEIDGAVKDICAAWRK